MTPTPATRARTHRRPVYAGWRRLPLRVRLVAGFAAVMLLVLAAAGGFVYLRVEYALDRRLNEDLATQSTQVLDATRAGLLHQQTNAAAGPVGVAYQILDTDNQVLVHSRSMTGPSLLRPDELDLALHRAVRHDRGGLFPISDATLRLYAVPVHTGTRPAAGQPAIVLVAIHRDQRDEALRELIGQLTLANLAALAAASVVGYRLTRAALAPVERYRTQAAQIAGGATGVRLPVPDTSHDEITRLGHTLNDMLTALDNALTSERRFVNDASHELRTPLTLLSAELELALRRPRSATELEATIRAAFADTANLIALTDTLLTIGLPQRPGPDTPPVNLATLVSDLVDRYRASTAADTIRLDIDTDIPTVNAEAARLRQVITNLLDNATRHGRPPITIAVTRAGPAVRISVHDNGDGIDPGFLPLATQRFRRADAARTSPGTGLGLSLAESIIIHAHDGELRICSHGLHHATTTRFDTRCTHPQTGTTATVLLPANLAAEDSGERCIIPVSGVVNPLSPRFRSPPPTR